MMWAIVILLVLLGMGQAAGLHTLAEIARTLSNIERAVPDLMYWIAQVKELSGDALADLRKEYRHEMSQTRATKWKRGGKQP